MAAFDGFAIPHPILRHFDLTSTPYTDEYMRDVERRRKTYPQGQLMLDQLLSLASITGHGLYPPSSPADLRRLLHSIHASEVDRLKQDCFYYYLLLDYDRSDPPRSQVVNGDRDDEGGSSRELAMSNGDNRDRKGKGRAPGEGAERAAEFARRRCLPKLWRVFITGYWALDHEEWEEAIDCLTDPAITSLNFLPDIFQLLSTHVSPASHSLRLIHSLFTALAPPLETPGMINLRAVSLTTVSLSETFNFVRSRPASDQLSLREEIWCWALGAPRLAYGFGAVGVQKDILTQLLHLPLLPDESAHLTQFLTHPPRSLTPLALNLLHDLVTLRMVHQGQYAESLALDKSLAGSSVGNDQDRQRRRETVRQFISVLPKIQREVLEVDVEARREGEVIQRNEDVEMGQHAQREQRAPISLKELVNGTMTPAPSEMSSTTSAIKPSSAPLASLVDGPPRLPSHLSTPAPLRHPSLSHLAAGRKPSGTTPSTPVADGTATPTRIVSSPFSGPPLFARPATPGTPNPPKTPAPLPGSPAASSRLVSGSPFVPPLSAARPGEVNGFQKDSGVEVPRPSRRVVDDEANPIADQVAQGTKGRIQRSRTLRNVSGHAAQSWPQSSADTPASQAAGSGPALSQKKPPPARKTRGASATPARSTRARSITVDLDAAGTNEMPPPPVPAGGPKGAAANHETPAAPATPSGQPRRSTRRVTSTSNAQPDTYPVSAQDEGQAAEPPSPTASVSTVHSTRSRAGQTQSRASRAGSKTPRQAKSGKDHGGTSGGGSASATATARGDGEDIGEPAGVAPPLPSPITRGMPGSFAPIEKKNGSPSAPGREQGQGRLRRSASRALLEDEGDAERGSRVKRRKGDIVDQAEKGEGRPKGADKEELRSGRSGRGREGSAAVGNDDKAEKANRGSPTPSTTSVISTRSNKVMRSSQSQRNLSAREGSATPRVTRSRKA